MIQSGVTTGTPQKILFGAGVYFKGITYDEKVAPTEEEVKAAIFGATQEGGTLNITPEFFMPELDDVHVAVRELQQKIGEKANMEVSFVELTPDLVAHMVIGITGETTDKNYDVVTSSDRIGKGHFYDGFGYWGHLMDGREAIILFKSALCTSGFTADPKSKTNALFKGTFECQSDIAYSLTKLPYVIFIRKAEGWVAIDPTEAAAA
jgi:hypothetical protein